ncbi:DUF4843 domain-containing protein [Sphingobacterium humi]|nr:DUF4843 domain-containing protein [Sphingobacterium humi]
MKRLLLLTISFLMLAGCKQNDLIDFNVEDAYISFALPDKSNRPKEPFLDSTYYSFATDTAIGIQSKVLAIPMHVGGVASNQARTYSVEIDPSSDYNPALVSLSEPVIRADHYADTLFLTIKRGEELLTKEMTLLLKLKENENFKVGHSYNRELKIVFSDVLVEPVWWATWQRYLGPYYKEVLQQWMQVYYFGADMSPDLYTGAPGPIYYWNNMPGSATASWYPITFMYIGVLKKYFEDHVVYPNGDASEERILLP